LEERKNKEKKNLVIVKFITNLHGKKNWVVFRMQNRTSITGRKGKTKVMLRMQKKLP
jgi:uncharacterized protein YvpB